MLSGTICPCCGTVHESSGCPSPSVRYASTTADIGITKDCHCMHGVICHACDLRITMRERARVVAWLRSTRPQLWSAPPSRSEIADWIADAIERGDHTKGGE